jgi:hypothetical protein
MAGSDIFRTVHSGRIAKGLRWNSYLAMAGYETPLEGKNGRLTKPQAHEKWRESVGEQQSRGPLNELTTLA